MENLKGSPCALAEFRTLDSPNIIESNRLNCI